MIYISNSFSLQMIMDGIISIETISIDMVRGLIGKIEEKNGELQEYTLTAKSAIGHADTAEIISDIIGIKIPMNRANIHLIEGDKLIIAQVSGGRLPEGSTRLPAGTSIVFKLVRIKSEEFQRNEKDAKLARDLRNEGIIRGPQYFSSIGEKLTNGGKEMSDEDLINIFE